MNQNYKLQNIDDFKGIPNFLGQSDLYHVYTKFFSQKDTHKLLDYNGFPTSEYPSPSLVPGFKAPIKIITYRELFWLLPSLYHDKKISRKFRALAKKSDKKLVGMRGLEPPTPSSPNWYATRLRYIPLFNRMTNYEVNHA